MSNVHLTGQLVCMTDAEARVVIANLPEHIERTRAEPGCILFAVTPTDDPLVWAVEEQFKDLVAFERHQDRVARSDWGRVTADIKRRYYVEGLSGIRQLQSRVGTSDENGTSDRMGTPARAIKT